MQQDFEKLVDRAVDRLVGGIERVLDAEGRFVVLEKDSEGHEDGIKYLRTQLHEVRTGSTAINLTNRELSMEVSRLKENDQKLADSLERMASAVNDLKTDGKVLAWKIGAIIGVLVFLAQWLADRVKL